MRNKCWVFLIFVMSMGMPLQGLFAADGAAPADGELVVGVFPRRDPAVTMRLFAPFAEYLQEHLGRPVRLETAADFKQFQARVDARRYDLVHFNQYHYVKAHEKLGYDVLAQNEEFGESGIRGAIYVRRDSGIENLQQLRGKKIMFGGGRDAMMSYLVPRFLLLEAGLKNGDYQELFATSPPNAVLATFLKHADAGGAGEVVRRLPLITKRIDVDALKIIAMSEPLPQLPWAVKTEMDETLRGQLQSLLLSLRDSARGRAVLKEARLTGFQPAKDQEYDVHRLIAERVENDL